MRSSVPESMEVKASGGIKTLDQVLGLLERGATRCGASATAQILEEFKKRSA